MKHRPCRCPGCASVIPPAEPRRICFKCQGPIDRYHKYVVEILEVRFKGQPIRVSAFRHRHCDNMQDYMSRAERIAWCKEKGVPTSHYNLYGEKS